MSSKFIFAFLCSFSFFAATISAQGIQFFQGTWAEAKTKAKKDNKPIFVDVYAVWCGPCKYMTNSVFTQKAVGDYFNANYINLKIDAEKGEGREFASNNAVAAYPTLLFFDANAKTLLNNAGSLEADELITMGKSALKANPNKGGNDDNGGGSDENGGSSDDNDGGGGVDYGRTLSNFRKGKLSIEEMQTFMLKLADNADPVTAADLLPILWDKLSIEQKLEETNFAIAYGAIATVRSAVFQDMLTLHAAYEEIYQYEVMPMLTAAILEVQFVDHFASIAEGKKSSKSEFFKDVAQYKPTYTAHYKAKYRYYDAVYNEKDDKELRAARKDYNDNYAEAPYELNNEAWQVVTSNGEYDTYANALTWIDKSLNLYNDYYATAIKAWIMFKTNKKEQARQLAEDALSRADDEPTTVGLVQDLLKQLD